MDKFFSIIGMIFVCLSSIAFLFGVIVYFLSKILQRMGIISNFIRFVRLREKAKVLRAVRRKSMLEKFNDPFYFMASIAGIYDKSSEAQDKINMSLTKDRSK